MCLVQRRSVRGGLKEVSRSMSLITVQSCNNCMHGPACRSTSMTHLYPKLIMISVFIVCCHQFNWPAPAGVNCDIIVYNLVHPVLRLWYVGPGHRTLHFHYAAELVFTQFGSQVMHTYQKPYILLSNFMAKMLWLHPLATISQSGGLQKDVCMQIGVRTFDHYLRWSCITNRGILHYAHTRDYYELKQ